MQQSNATKYVVGKLKNYERNFAHKKKSSYIADKVLRNPKTKTVMVLSKACIYGIQAAIYVASVKDVGYVSIQEISEKLNISFHFLTKVLQQLTQAGILNSYRGPKGGVALAKQSEHISLYNVIAAIDGTDIFTECMLGLPGCGIATPCPAHDSWAEMRSKLFTICHRTTLRDLAEKANQYNVRLANLPLTI